MVLLSVRTEDWLSFPLPQLDPVELVLLSGVAPGHVVDVVVVDCPRAVGLDSIDVAAPQNQMLLFATTMLLPVPAPPRIALRQP